MEMHCEVRDGEEHHSGASEFYPLPLMSLNL